MKTLIRNVVIVTMNEQNKVVESGAIAIDGNRISYVGPAAWTPPGPFARTIDGDRLIAMPGMVNAHCHSPANLVRGMMPSKPLEIWRAYYRASLRGMRDEDFYASALLGGMEMLKNGATTVLDHFFGNQACRFMGAGAAIQAMRDLGLRHVVALTLSDKNYEETIPLGETTANLADEIKRMSASEAKATKAWLDECEAFVETFHAPERLTTACPGPSAVQRCTDELLGESAKIARKRNLPLHIHLAETKAQAVVGQQIYRTSLLNHLDSTGVHVALGTDGSASNNGQNMFDAVQLVELIHNQAGTDFKHWVTPVQAISM